MNQDYLQMLCHRVVDAYDVGGDHLRTAIESLRIALSGKSKADYADELDNTPLTFGKYKSHTPKEVSVIDPSYIVWMYDSVKPAKCSKELRNGCEWQIREGQAEYWESVRGESPLEIF